MRELVGGAIGEEGAARFGEWEGMEDSGNGRMELFGGNR